jgi:hypothetical protein
MSLQEDEGAVALTSSSYFVKGKHELNTDECTYIRARYSVVATHVRIYVSLHVSEKVGIHEGFQTFTRRDLTNIPVALPIYLAFDLQKHSRDFLSSPLEQTLVNTINGDGNVGCIRTGEVRPALADMISENKS